MRRCLSCNALFPSSLSDCPICGAQTAMVDGFHAYAPELAHVGSGFKSSYFAELVALEERNFWFMCRNRLILSALKKWCPKIRSFLEIGCGTGYVLSGIAKAFPGATLSGSEIFTAGLDFAAGRQPAVNFMQMDATNIPFSEEFDVIGAFDVLEHIDDDVRVLSQVHSALQPRGHLVLTVPQHPWLWSPVDDHACHVRRYDASDLHRKIESVGFQIVRTTSFVSLLLPAMMISRFFQRNNSRPPLDARAELEITPWLNTLFTKVLSLEIAAIKCGMNFSVGGSRLVVARKKTLGENDERL